MKLLPAHWDVNRLCAEVSSPTTHLLVPMPAKRHMFKQGHEKDVDSIVEADALPVAVEVPAAVEVVQGEVVGSELLPFIEVVGAIGRLPSEGPGSISGGHCVNTKLPDVLTIVDLLLPSSVLRRGQRTTTTESGSDNMDFTLQLPNLSYFSEWLLASLPW